MDQLISECLSALSVGDPSDRKQETNPWSPFLTDLSYVLTLGGQVVSWSPPHAH